MTTPQETKNSVAAAEVDSSEAQREEARLAALGEALAAAGSADDRERLGRIMVCCPVTWR